MSKYIRITAVLLCVVCLLMASCTRAVDAGFGEEVSMSSVSTQYTERSLKSEDIESSTSEELTESEKVEGKESEQEYIVYFTDRDIVDLAKVLLRECGGVPSKTEQACVAWCVLNRVDEYDSNVYEVVREPYQFAFSESAEVREDLYELAKDVISRWNDEKNGNIDSGRVLPKEYTYFHGDGAHNYFRNAFSGDYDTWNYSLESPYEN